MSVFTPEKLAYMEAHINDTRVRDIHWVYSVPIAAATISTALRLWAKRAGRNGITLDDYLIVAATVRSSPPVLLALAHRSSRVDMPHWRVCERPRLWYDHTSGTLSPRTS
jgi:hypothetical protein